MRRKRQEDYQAVVDKLSGMQAENAKLKQVCEARPQSLIFKTAVPSGQLIVLHHKMQNGWAAACLDCFA